jgi:hypothetical protein
VWVEADRLKWQRRYSHPVEPDTGVRSDQTVVLATTGLTRTTPHRCAGFAYFDADQQRFLVLPTNVSD